jgi:hypothetical protein
MKEIWGSSLVTADFLDLVRKKALAFLHNQFTTSSSVRLCWNLEEPEGPQGPRGGPRGGWSPTWPSKAFRETHPARCHPQSPRAQALEICGGAKNAGGAL